MANFYSKQWKFQIFALYFPIEWGQLEINLENELNENWILLYFYRRKYDNLHFSLMSILLTREMKKFVPFLDFFWYFLFYWVKNHESAAGFSFFEWFSFSENEQIPFLDFPEFSKSDIALLKIFLVTRIKIWNVLIRIYSCVYYLELVIDMLFLLVQTKAFSIAF